MPDSPAYSPTDVGAAIVVLLGFGLDIATGYGAIPAVDPATRVPLMASLTLVVGFGIAAYVKNRSVKHQVAGQVSVANAQVAAALASIPPAPALAPVTVTAPAVPFAGGSFVITPAPPSVAPEPVPKPKPPTSGTPPPTQQHLAADTGLPSTPPQP